MTGVCEDNVKKACLTLKLGTPETCNQIKLSKGFRYTCSDVLEAVFNFVSGYEWVGWANNASQQYPIEITFEFDAVRNFSLVSLFTNVHYSRGIQVRFRVTGPSVHKCSLQVSSTVFWFSRILS